MVSNNQNQTNNTLSVVSKSKASTLVEDMNNQLKRWSCACCTKITTNAHGLCDVCFNTEAYKQQPKHDINDVYESLYYEEKRNEMLNAIVEEQSETIKRLEIQKKHLSEILRYERAKTKDVFGFELVD